MNTWFTADHHFGHKAILSYARRPFVSVEEMDEELIAKWNAFIKPSDTVWHLGDFSFYSPAKTREITSRLQGNIHLILGNHDSSRGRPKLYQELFASVRDYYRLRFENHRIILCHYPFETWHGAHKGAWHLHGHSHGSLPPRGGRLDVGVDPSFQLWHIDSVIDYMKDHPYEAVDHHK